MDEAFKTERSAFSTFDTAMVKSRKKKQPQPEEQIKPEEEKPEEAVESNEDEMTAEDQPKGLVDCCPAVCYRK